MIFVRWGRHWVFTLQTDYLVFPFSVSMINQQYVVTVNVHFLFLHFQYDFCKEFFRNARGGKK